MQRNKALAKEILNFLVDNGDGDGIYRCQIHQAFAQWHPDRELGRMESVDYHLHLLTTGGYLRRGEMPDGDDVFAITWAGHDLLEGPGN